MKHTNTPLRRDDMLFLKCRPSFKNTSHRIVRSLIFNRETGRITCRAYKYDTKARVR
jgi:hypothetical protein